MSYKQHKHAAVANPAGRTGSRLSMFRARCVAWEAAGCSPRAAAALADAEIDEGAQIACLGRGFFARVPNCGPATVAEIGRLIGGWPEDNETTIDGSVISIPAREAPREIGHSGAGTESVSQPSSSRAVAVGVATGSMIAGSFGDVEVVRFAGRVFIAVKAGHYDAAGFLHRDHAVAGLSVDHAISVRDELSEEISAIQVIEDPRQARLWPHAMCAAPHPIKDRRWPAVPAGEAA